MMMSYLYCCGYYYCRQMFRTAGYTLATLWVMFMIHKLFSWGLWVLSM